MAPAVDEATQSSIDALVDSVDKRDALLTFHWVHELKPSGRSALSMPSSVTGLSALESAVQAIDLPEPADVLGRLQNAHSLIIQVLLLAGAEPMATGLGGTTPWALAQASSDLTALRLLQEWDMEDYSWPDAEHVRATLVDGELENWLRRMGYDRETEEIPGTMPKQDVSDLARVPPVEAVVEPTVEGHVVVEAALATAAIKPEPEEDVEIKPVITSSTSPVSAPPERDVKPTLVSSTSPPARADTSRTAAAPATTDTLAFSTPMQIICSSPSPRPLSSAPLSPPARPPPRVVATPTSLPQAFADQNAPIPSTSKLAPATDLPPPMAHIRAKYRPLVESFRAFGYKRIPRGRIANAIESAGEPIEFRSLSEEAERSGIVELGDGGTLTEGWIRLAIRLPELEPTPFTSASTHNRTRTSFYRPPSPPPSVQPEAFRHQATPDSRDAQLWVSAIIAPSSHRDRLRNELKRFLSGMMAHSDVLSITFDQRRPTSSPPSSASTRESKSRVCSSVCGTGGWSWMGRWHTLL